MIEASGPLLSVRDVKKAFGATLALAGVSLDVSAGEVHAVIGENGAGKSTLMGILGGALVPDSGTIVFDDAPFAPKSPRSAHDRGVRMVHQELSLCPHLSVAENIVLGREPTRRGWIATGELRQRARLSLAATVGEARARTFPLDARVDTLPLADRQLVEIARALAGATCRLLILDEPTSSLGRAEARALFERIRALKLAGIAILYISHFLEEVIEIADRFTVLRDGRTVGNGDVRATSIPALVQQMVGRPVSQLFVRSARTRGDVALACRDVAGGRPSFWGFRPGGRAVAPGGRARVAGESAHSRPPDEPDASPTRLPVHASFEVRSGEILGIAGIVGAGRTELLRVLYGLDPRSQGTVRVFGSDAPRSPAEAIAAGMGMLSEDRKGEGLLVTRSIAANLTLSSLGVLLRRSRELAAARHWVARLGIRTRDVDDPVGNLSGGNQQKVALGRLMHQRARILLLDQPGRGVDVAAKSEMYRLIDGLAVAGAAIVVVSDDLSELLGVSDRIAVMHRGVLGPARPVDDWTEASLLAEAVGGAR